MSQLVPPEVLRGTRDFLPLQMAKRQYVADAFREVFRRFGYDAIETPAIEYAKTILGKYGDEGNKLTYTFEDNGGRKIALRYDQTVPFARVVAANHRELPMPFKRYEINRVWRADRPGKGRYREFYQCDIDIIGTESLVADAEIARVAYVALHELGFKKFVVKCNSRRLMNSIFASFGIEADQFTSVLRVLDKIEKIGRDAVASELSEIISADTTQRLLSLVLMEGSNAHKIEAVREYNSGEISEFLELCDAFGIPEDYIEFDLSLARGLDYYTGIIFEVVPTDVQMGSLAGGGRYDDLCSMFCKEKLSGVGIAFGFDRIIATLEEMGALTDIGLSTRVLVTCFDAQTQKNSLAIASLLHNAGIPTEVYPDVASLKKQLKFANKKRIPLVVFCGPEEMERGVVKVKNMETGEEEVVEQSLVGEYAGFLEY